jgi:hypothetical protein
MRCAKCGAVQRWSHSWPGTAKLLTRPFITHPGRSLRGCSALFYTLVIVRQISA